MPPQRRHVSWHGHVHAHAGVSQEEYKDSLQLQPSFGRVRMLRKGQRKKKGAESAGCRVTVAIEAPWPLLPRMFRNMGLSISTNFIYAARIKSSFDSQLTGSKVKTPLLVCQLLAATHLPLRRWTSPLSVRCCPPPHLSTNLRCGWQHSRSL